MTPPFLLPVLMCPITTCLEEGSMAQHRERASLVPYQQSPIRTLLWPRHTLVTMTTRHNMQRLLLRRMQLQRCQPPVTMQLHMRATPHPMIPPDTIDIETPIAE